MVRRERAQLRRSSQFGGTAVCTPIWSKVICRTVPGQCPTCNRECFSRQFVCPAEGVGDIESVTYLERAIISQLPFYSAFEPLSQQGQRMAWNYKLLKIKAVTIVQRNTSMNVRNSIMEEFPYISHIEETPGRQPQRSRGKSKSLAQPLVAQNAATLARQRGKAQLKKEDEAKIK